MDNQDFILQAKKLSLFYGEKQALKDVDIKIHKNKATALIGPSGCGKSTLLRCFNRMNDLLDNCRISGEIYYHANNIHASGVDVVQLRKKIGMVFQHFNLFDKALEEYDYVISADSNYYQAYFNKGYVHINGTGNYESAVKNLTAAIKIDSTAHKAWYNRGVAYEMMGKLKLAELDYRKALEVLPNYELAVNALNDVIAKQR